MAMKQTTTTDINRPWSRKHLARWTSMDPRATPAQRVHELQRLLRPFSCQTDGSVGPAEQRTAPSRTGHSEVQPVGTSRRGPASSNPSCQLYPKFTIDLCGLNRGDCFVKVGEAPARPPLTSFYCVIDSSSESNGSCVRRVGRGPCLLFCMQAGLGIFMMDFYHAHTQLEAKVTAVAICV